MARVSARRPRTAVQCCSAGRPRLSLIRQALRPIPRTFPASNRVRWLREVLRGLYAVTLKECRAETARAPGASSSRPAPSVAPASGSPSRSFRGSSRSVIAGARPPGSPNWSGHDRRFAGLDRQDHEVRSLARQNRQVCREVRQISGCRSCPRSRRSLTSCASAPTALPSRGWSSARSACSRPRPAAAGPGWADRHRGGAARQVPRPGRRRPAPDLPPGPRRVVALERRALHDAAAPGKSPIALRCRLSDGSGFDLTEAGTRKRLAAYIVRDPAQVPGIATLGPDPLADGFGAADLAAMLGGRRTRIKGLLRDQGFLAASATPTPTRSCTPPGSRRSPWPRAWTRSRSTVSTPPCARSSSTPSASRRANRPRSSRTPSVPACACTAAPLPCPVCGDTVREVSFADSSLQYCPTCQTAASRSRTGGCRGC